MNADQVIEGIGQAVAAVAPQEYCLFWSDYWWWMCMTKSEWSGWMQAVGAVLAIFGAFYLSKRQEFNIQHRLKKSALIKVKLFALSVSVSAEALRDSIQVNEFEMLRQQALLRETLALGVSISAEMLNMEWLTAFEASRSIAAQLHVLCEAVSRDSRNFPTAKKMAGNFCDKMSQVESVLKKPHPGIRFSKAESMVPTMPFFMEKASGNR